MNTNDKKTIWDNNIFIFVLMIFFVAAFLYLTTIYPMRISNNIDKVDWEIAKEIAKNRDSKDTINSIDSMSNMNESTQFIETEHKYELEPKIVMNPMYKNLEKSLRILYDWPDVYIEESPKSRWYIPYFGPQTRSEKDVPQFIEFAKKVIKDYPQSTLHKHMKYALREFDTDEEITHPVILKIWRSDEEEINKRANILINKDYNNV